MSGVGVTSTAPNNFGVILEYLGVKYHNEKTSFIPYSKQSNTFSPLSHHGVPTEILSSILGEISV